MITGRNLQIFSQFVEFSALKRALWRRCRFLKAPLFIGSELGLNIQKKGKLSCFGAEAEEFVVAAWKHSICNFPVFGCCTLPISSLQQNSNPLQPQATAKILILLILLAIMPEKLDTAQNLNFSPFCQFLWIFLLVFNLLKKKKNTIKINKILTVDKRMKLVYQILHKLRILLVPSKTQTHKLKQNKQNTQQPNHE